MALRRSVLSYLEDDAVRHSGRCAVIDEGGSCTYEQLRLRARKAGSALAEAGARHRAVVVYMEKGIDALRAMFGALSVVLGYYSFKITPNLKIGFGSIPNMLVDYLFGPVVGGLFGGAMDVIKFMLKPDGGFMPGFTFNAMLAAFIYGLFFYKKNLSLPRILTAKLVVIVLCNIVLGTYWLTLLNGKGFLAILPARAIKNLIQWPVDSLIFFLVAKTLEQAGVFKLILHAGNRQRR